MIGSHETDLVGKWEVSSGKVKPDETALRIKSLIENWLERIGPDHSGWDILYRDPSDGRLWELTYPQSHLHGGGPPRLTAIAPAAAQAKYLKISNNPYQP